MVGRCAAVIADGDQASTHCSMNVVLVSQRRNDDDAANAMGKQVVEEIGFLFPVPVRAAQQYAIAVAFLRDDFDLVGQRSVRGILDRGNEQAHQRRMAGLELACGAVRLESEFGNNGLDARQRFLAHAFGTGIQRIRDRANRDAGALRHVLDGDGLVFHHQGRGKSVIVRSWGSGNEYLFDLVPDSVQNQ